MLNMPQEGMQIFQRSQFSSGDSDGSESILVAEISDLRPISVGDGDRELGEEFVVSGFATGPFRRTFKFSGTDGSEGDIAGWRYDEVGAVGRFPTEVLIIND